MLGIVLIGVLIAVGMWGWVPLASAGVNEVKPKAPVPQTGQTTCWQIGNGQIDCDGTGQDGDIQAGVPFPALRFTAKNGAVRDNLAGLIWLQQADCFSSRSWTQALTDANTLHDSGTPATTDDCGLSDGSVEGDWRLPNVKELLSLIDYGQFDPALPAGHPFLNVATTGTTGETGYWTSTTRLSDASFDVANPFVIRLQEGTTWLFSLPPAVYRVWPVGGGQLAMP
jgi:hypothetical protein